MCCVGACCREFVYGIVSTGWKLEHWEYTRVSCVTLWLQQFVDNHFKGRDSEFYTMFFFIFWDWCYKVCWYWWSRIVGDPRGTSTLIPFKIIFMPAYEYSSLWNCKSCYSFHVAWRFVSVWSDWYSSPFWYWILDVWLEYWQFNSLLTQLLSSDASISAVSCVRLRSYVSNVRR
jgi:hypothetical protein